MLRMQYLLHSGTKDEFLWIIYWSANQKCIYRRKNIKFSIYGLVVLRSRAPNFVFCSNLFSNQTVSKVYSCQWTTWQYGLWSFQAGGTKLERFLPKNQHTQRKLLNFENWVNGEVSKSARIYIKNWLWNLSHFFSLGAYFLLLTFFDNIEIERLLFLKWCLFFDTSPLIQFSKFNNFLWACWFLGKNLSNFVPPLEDSTTLQPVLL